MKKLILFILFPCLIALNASAQTTVSPSTMYRGQTLTTTITNNFIAFDVCTRPVNSNDIYMQHGSTTFYADSFNVVNPTTLTADFTIPPLAPFGVYNFLINISIFDFFSGCTNVYWNYYDYAYVTIGSQNITGTAYFDANGNGLKDAGETGLANRKIMLLPDSEITFTDYNGNYKLYLDPGTYSVAFDTGDTLWHVSSGVSTYTGIVVNTTNITGKDFALQQSQFIHDIVTSFFPPNPRCNATRTSYLYYRNNGTVPSDGIVKLNYSASLVFVSANPSPASVSGDTITWNFTNLNIQESRLIQITFTYPGAGVPLVFTSYAEMDSAGNLMDTDTKIRYQITTCSYDPNDKAVSPEGIAAAHYVVMDQPLDYTIRFQNTGNDTAYNVLVIDTIDSNLDLSTFEMIGSTAPVSVSMFTNGRVEFLFENINLPDSGANQSGSNGYITFRIHPKPFLPDPTAVYNKSYIIFDLNAPVATNTVWNTFSNNLIGITNPPTYNTDVKFYPNPFSKEATLQFVNPDKKKYSIVITDMLGREMMKQEIRTDRIFINRKGWMNGMYMYRIRGLENNFDYIGRFVIEE